MATNPHNLRSGSSATLAPIVPEDALPGEPEVQDSQSVHNMPAPSDNTTAINTQIQLAKIQLASEKERTKQAEPKARGRSTPDLLLPAPKCPCYEKRVKDEELYHTKDYPHYWQYVHQIEQLPMELYLDESNRYLDYLVAERWTAHHDEKRMEDTWDNQKAFLKSQLGDCDNQVYNAWMEWMNCHKLGSESDDEYLCRSDELLAQIGNEAKDYHQIQLMVFFKGLDQAMKQKICGHPVFPNSREDLVTLAKKLRPSIGSEPHSLATTANAGFNASTSAKTTKQNDRKPSTTTVTTKLPELEPPRDRFFDGDCNYCGKHGHKEGVGLSEEEEYLDINLANGFIQPSQSSAGAPVLFAPKGDGGLRLCVDYRGLNAITQKNRYPLPLIDKIMDLVCGARVFTKIDVKNAYYRIRNWEGNEWKTAFRTRYRLYEYLVMLFGLTNAPASFQSYIHGVLREYLDIFVIVFLDDILIYSREESQHEQHIRIVLEALLIAGLFASFPKSVREVQTFLGFVNFYRKFIQGFSCIATPLTEAIKGSNTKLKKELVSRKAGFLSPEAQMAFRVLICAFTTAPFLQHFDVTLPIQLKTDASGYAISGILSQKHPDGWRVTAYFSRKMIPAERKYETHDGELLAIVESFRQWRHYLEGSTHLVEVLSDHSSLRSFMTTHKLSRRQLRWALSLSAYDFVITYQKRTLSPADDPSQRPDHQREADQEDQIEDALVLQRVLFPTVALISVEPRDNLLAQDIHLCELLVAGTTSPRQQSQRKQASEAVSHEEPYEEVGTSLIDSLPEFLRIDPLGKHMLEQITARKANPGMSDAHPLWSQRDDLLYFDLVLYIPYTESLQLGIIKKHHDEPLAGHLAAEKTFVLICAKYYWPDMRKQIQKYYNSCLVCQGARVIRGKQPGLLQPIPTPKRVWEVLTLDFITGLPESHAYGGVYNAILVVVCKFSKMAHYIPARKD
ncbi:Reverse transcriptase domain [Lasallia pustulata]|uniref:Reverse transcriptase domain n=1 Tax=Lasallia pustulata TaxID=136370 RepID=A0A1W5CWW9_9LECA|nr:Reverse transcriptase domain [Lasallia pustulata]